MIATDGSTDITTVVGRFPAAVEHGRTTDLDGVYANDAALDATVPNWRFEVHGAAAIIAEYGRWFSYPARFEELVRRPIAEGEVVSYVLGWRRRVSPTPATTATCSPSAPAASSATRCVVRGTLAGRAPRRDGGGAPCSLTSRPPSGTAPTSSARGTP